MPTPVLYPIFLQLHGHPVLVVGAGAVGLRKAVGLAEAGALVTVISPAFAAGFEGVEVERVKEAYAGKWMKGRPWRLVFAATNLPDVNAQIAQDAHTANIWCCRADDGEAGDFFNAATIREGGITVAISTGGGSPVLGGKVRDAVAAGLDPVMVGWSAVLPMWRERVKGVLTGERRAGLLQRIAGVEMEGVLRTYGRERAEAVFERWLEEARG